VKTGVEMLGLRGHGEDGACRKTSPVEKSKRFEGFANHRYLESEQKVRKFCGDEVAAAMIQRT